VSTRILVVEDNAFSREMLCDWLELQGYAVESASTLAEAFTTIEKSLPDAVLLDVQLGSADGLTLAAWLRLDQGKNHIPVIAVTAHAMVTEQDRIMHSGCNACISKPIDFKLLAEQLKRWLTVACVMKRDSRSQLSIGDADLPKAMARRQL